ncbi:MAG TPA: SIS domain-containing protein [Balneolaceae bacterium]
MNHLFSQKKTSKGNRRGVFTSAEIECQPQTWNATWTKIQEEKNALTSFLKNIIAVNDLSIVLTGAGSSAFIGDTVLSNWLTSFSKPTQTIPTTDLVTHFKERVVIDKPLLLISFARSGNSPESTAVIELANKLCDKVYHLIITCNPNGKLALINEDNSYIFLLPPETEDKSLAMTNSFTSMALAATLIPMLFSSEIGAIEKQVKILSEYGEKVIAEYSESLSDVSQNEFDRIIFLGSGSLWGIAKESHLKVQELTNGKVVGKFDSFLGFRHGPKAVINDKTLLVYLLSNKKETKPYERDLVDQVVQHKIDLKTLAISETTCDHQKVDFSISLNRQNELDEAFWAILCTLPAQIIGFYKSLALGYNPDNPSPDGTISRVVQGVKIYNGAKSKVQR